VLWADVRKRVNLPSIIGRASYGTVACTSTVHASKGRKEERKEKLCEQANEWEEKNGRGQARMVSRIPVYSSRLVGSTLQSRLYSTAQDRAKRNPEANGYALVLVLFVQHIAVECRR